ncbi:MAG: hypothetical protein JWM28_2364, partial [Chitinophagaceae bacterium]|nr:hypothetical protein [Chitinophagaceae bacterium]
MSKGGIVQDLSAISFFEPEPLHHS